MLLPVPDVSNLPVKEMEEYLYLYYKNNPMEWIRDCVETMDEHDKFHPYKKFPIEKKPYLAEIAKLWLEYPWVLIGKSRQIMISWLLVILYVHECQFHEGRYVYFQSETEDLADALTMRAYIVWSRQPKWLRRRCPINKPDKHTFCSLKFLHNSEIVGIPHGADKIRSRTATGIYMDEACTMQEFEEAFTAAIPSVEGGGRLTAVSSAKPSYFWRLLTRDGGDEGEVTIERTWTPCRGITAKMRSDDYLALMISYYADPMKDPATEIGKCWYVPAKKHAKERQWRQEMELDAYALGGEAVYPEFSPAVHVIEPFEIPPDWTRYMCIDPGLRNPTGALWAATSPENQLFFYREYYEAGIIVKANAKNILALEEEGKDPKIFLRLIDPAADIRNPVTGTNVKQEYAQHGIYTTKANNDVDAGINMVKSYLTVRDDGQPSVFFFSTLENTIKEITNYQYEKQSSTTAEKADPKEKPRKKSDHLMDCLRYICMRNPHYVKVIKGSKLSAFRPNSPVFAGYSK